MERGPCAPAPWRWVATVVRPLPCVGLHGEAMKLPPPRRPETRFTCLPPSCHVSRGALALLTLRRTAPPRPAQSGLRVLAVNILGKFLASRDPNIK